VIMATDIDHDFATAHRRNHPDIPFLEKDITLFSPDFFKFICNGHHVHLVSGGPPCQGFSMNGNRDTDDPRNKLFKHYVKILKVLNPEFFFMENVTGMLSMKNKNGERFIDEVMRDFKKLRGYTVDYKVINMADYGVPQTRKRVVMIGNRLGFSIDECIPVPEYGEDRKYKYEKSGKYIMGLVNVPEQALPNHRRMNHNESVVRTMSMVKEGHYMPKDLPKDSIKKKTFQTVYRRVDRNKPAPTMVPGHSAFPIHPTENRSLTFREAARLQTFRDDYVFYGTTIKQGLAVGNAVPPLFVQRLGEHLLNLLKTKTEKTIKPMHLTRC
ncbi:MAG: DNA cytosine methyltransferase, partial [Nitrososphaerales archaeon]